MAEEGAIASLIGLLSSPNELIQRQSAKALANLGVNTDNKPKIAAAGGIPKLIVLAGTSLVSVRIEAIAALANLAVNDNNELEIVRCGGLEPIVAGTMLAADGLDVGALDGGRGDKDSALLEELATQCARALRNLSVNRK
jgi:HEAT repeat protein